MAVVMEIDERVLAAKFEVILPHLDERQRRLLLAAEARSLGYGGVSLVAQAAGVSRVTVTTGVEELEAGADPMPGRARRPGGGRIPLTEADPALLDALDALVEPETRGDPVTRLRWTTKSTRNLAGELGRQGHRKAAAEASPPACPVGGGGETDCDEPGHQPPGRGVRAGDGAARPRHPGVDSCAVSAGSWPSERAADRCAVTCW